MPDLPSNDYYWHQLEGLAVYRLDGEQLEGEQKVLLGRVAYLFETGANDVLVVRSDSGEEVLVPYLPDQVVLSVDVAAGEMIVDWLLD